MDIQDEIKKRRRGIAQRIRDRRIELGLSVEEIAAELGKSRATVYRYESSDIQKLPVDVLPPLSEILETTPSYLMGWTDDPYDYDRDIDNRFASIPIAIYDSLREQYGDDLKAVWDAWLQIEEDSRQEYHRMQANPKDSPVPPGFIPMPEMVKVPLIGRIACGQPITAEENVEGLVDAPKNARCDFALRCEGDSMIDAGISEGDVVFIRSQPEVNNGQIAAVRIGDEATLKRVYWNGKVLQLLPENRSYPPLVFSGQELEQIHIEGLAVAFVHWF